MWAKGARRNGHAPRRINGGHASPGVGSGGEPVEGLCRKIEHINQAMARPRHIIFFLRILLCESDDNEPAKGLNVKGSITGWSARIGKLHQLKVVVVNIHFSFRKVGGQQPWSAGGRRQRNSFVNRTRTDRQYFSIGAQRTAP